MNFARYVMYGCGQLGMMALARFFFQWIVKFPDAGGTPPGPDGTGGEPLFLASAIGLVFFFFRLFDGFTDPVAGILSDSWIARGRARRSLLWFSFLLPPAGLVLVFSPTMAMSPTLRWTLVTLGMFLFFVGYTFYAIPYWSLMDDYAGSDDAQRRVLSNVLGAGLLGATAVGFVVSGELIERYGFRVAATYFAVPATFLMLLPYFAQPPGLAPPQLEPKQDDAGIFDGVLVALRHRKFVAVLAILAGSQMSFTVMTAGAADIVTDLLEGTLGDVALLLGPFLLSAIPFFAMVPFISRRMGWQKGIVLASLALGAVYVCTGALGRSIVYSPWVTAGLVFALGGPMAAMLLGLEGEAITECAREAGGKVTAIYFGVFNLVIKGMNAIAIYMTSLLHDQAKPELWGTNAVRAMGPMAGGLLVVGVVAYFLIKPAKDAPEA